MLLQITYILCFLSYYCQGQSSNDILYTSNPLIETVPSRTTSTKTTSTTTTPTRTTTEAPVTYNELNLFTSNPILIESNDLPDVVPLLSNNTASNTSIPILTTEIPSETLFPEITFSVTSTSTPPTIEPITIADRNQVVTSSETQQPVTFPNPEPPTNFPETQEPTIVVQSSSETQQPVTFPNPEPPTNFPETQEPTIVVQSEIDSATESIPSATLPATTIKQLIALAINNILPSSRKCGASNDHTSWYDGSVSNIDEFPWLVLLKYEHYHYHNAGYRCLGTLISRRYVITEAYCVVTQGKITGPKTAILGEYKISSPVDCIYNFYTEECADNVVELPIVKHFLHPQYNNYNYGNNNLALLRLESDVKFSRFIAPICLPTQNLIPPMAGKILVTSGWGATENGVEVDVKIRTTIKVLSDSQCLIKLYRQMYVSQHQVCIGKDYQKHIFRADYGGPVMSADRNGNQQWFLEGIISGGFGCGRNGVPNIYTRISPYVEWILSTMALDTYNAM